MKYFGSFRLIDLSDERKQQLRKLLTVSHAILAAEAQRLLADGSPKAIRALRDGHKAGSLVVSVEARTALLELAAVEEEVIAGYIRVADPLCQAFHVVRTAELSLDDFIQEAAIAIYNATYTYDGSTQFSTYVYWCVKNHLITYSRAQHATMPSMGDGIEEAVVAPSQPEHREETDLMWRAVRQAGLSQLQRELFEAHIAGNQEFRRRLVEERVNPNTGRPYTRQRLSQIYQQAVEIVVQEYEYLKAA